jgi:tetratricopeptide (TPR) repeat protein
MRVALVLAVLVVLSPLSEAAGAVARAAEDQAEAGRRHVKKASSLAGSNRCRAAIPEYTKAFELLKDPAILFNRAECYRRLHENQKAVADYRRFLVELPTAPNRAQVEARIAELAPPAPSTPPATPIGTPAAQPAATPVSAPAPVVEAPTPAATPVARTDDTAATVAASSAGVDGTPPAPPAAATAAAAATPTMAPTPVSPALGALDQALPPEDSGADGSVVSRWWFWTAVAAVLVGGAVATYFILESSETETPPTALGNYRF